MAGCAKDHHYRQHGKAEREQDARIRSEGKGLPCRDAHSKPAAFTLPTSARVTSKERRRCRVGHKRDQDGFGDWMTKSDTRLAEERVRRLEKDVEVFQAWVDKRGQLRERIIKKVRGSYWARLSQYPLLHQSGWLLWAHSNKSDRTVIDYITVVFRFSRGWCWHDDGWKGWVSFLEEA